MMIAIISIATVLALSLLIMGFLKRKYEKKRAALNEVDFSRELQHTERYKQEYLQDFLPFVLTQMEGKQIDSFQFANLEYTTKDMMKDGLKDTLRSFATLGTVKYNTIQTPKYLVLSEGNLHLLDTNADGEICSDLLFNPNRLQQSSLQEIDLVGKPKAAAAQVGDDIKGYKLTLATDHSPIELLLFSSLISTSDFVFSTKKEKVIKEVVIGNDFLTRLGDLYPHLKVSSFIK